MINTRLQLQLSSFSELYDQTVDQHNFFRRLHDDIDFDEITKVLLPKYSINIGRTAYKPSYMFKLCLIKVMTDLSDVDLIEQVRVNLAYKYFLDMNPEDMPCDATTLCKFRRQRIGDTNLLQDLLDITFRFAEQKGIKKRVNGKFVIRGIIDATHNLSGFNYCRPVPALKELAKKMRCALYNIDENLTETLSKDKDIRSTDLKGEIQYCKNLIDFVVKNYSVYLNDERFKKIYNRLKEAVDDIHTYYSGDPEAGIGHKSADTNFYGYKTTITVDADTGMVVAASVSSGEVGDALSGKEVVETILQSDDYELIELNGDTAYSGQPFLELARDNNFEMLTTPHPILGTSIDGRDGFTFNKDADMFICPNGHLAIGKRTISLKKDNNKRIIYRFDNKLCATCPLKDTCLGNRKEKTFSVSVVTSEQQKLLQDNQTPEYRRRRKERYKIEALNSHLKNAYAFRKAQCIGKSMMTLQAGIAMFVHNIRKIYRKSDNQ